MLFHGIGKTEYGGPRVHLDVIQNKLPFLPVEETNIDRSAVERGHFRFARGISGESGNNSYSFVERSIWANPCRHINDHVALAPDEADGLFEKSGILNGLAGQWVPYMQMHDCRSCLPTLNGRFGDLFRRVGHVAVLLPCCETAGWSNGDNSLFHEVCPYLMRLNMNHCGKSNITSIRYSQ